MVEKQYCRTCGQDVVTPDQKLRSLLDRVSIKVPREVPLEEFAAFRGKFRDNILDTLIELMDDRIRKTSR